MPQNPHVLLTFGNVQNPLRLPRKTTSEHQKVLRIRQFFTLLTSKCASRHNGVRFFICQLPRWLRTGRFSEPTFRPSGATKLEKHGVLRLSYLLAQPDLLSSGSFSTLIFSLLLVSSLNLPTSAFPSVHIVGSLTSKLPSVIYMICLKLYVLYVQ